MTQWVLHIARRTSLALGLVFLGATVALAQRSSPGTTVIVVRHAEKATQPTDDPPLTAAGDARARALFDAVRDAGVSAIITTQFARTRATARPTAEGLGITPEIVSTTAATHIQDVAAAVRRHAGETVLVVGHSNTVPGIVAALGASQPVAICDSQYDNIYIVSMGARVGVTHAKFGERSPADSSCASTMR